PTPAVPGTALDFRPITLPSTAAQDGDSRHTSPEPDMKKYLTECIGTSSLVLTIGCTVVPGAAGVIPPLAIGSALMVMIYAGGHIYGAHYNPAVTLAVWIRGKCLTKDVIPYWISQFIGAALAALVVGFLF